MWVHVVIFVMILCALTGWKKGWIPSSGIGGKDGIRLFAVVAIAGNLLGMILTLQKRWTGVSSGIPSGKGGYRII